MMTILCIVFCDRGQQVVAEGAQKMPGAPEGFLEEVTPKVSYIPHDLCRLADEYPRERHVDGDRWVYLCHPVSHIKE